MFVHACAGSGQREGRSRGERVCILSSKCIHECIALHLATRPACCAPRARARAASPNPPRACLVNVCGVPDARRRPRLDLRLHRLYHLCRLGQRLDGPRSLAGQPRRRRLHAVGLPVDGQQRLVDGVVQHLVVDVLRLRGVRQAALQGQEALQAQRLSARHQNLEGVGGGGKGRGGHSSR